MEKTDWTEVRNAYITGKESLQKLAEKYGISLRTIKDRSRRENWVEERKKFRTKVALNTSQKTAKKEVRRLAKLQDAAEDVAELIGQDVARIKKQREKLRMITPEDVKMIKDLTAALKNIAEVMRDVYDIPTIREKLLQMKYEDWKKTLAEMEKGGEEGLLMLAAPLEEEEENGMENMDGEHGGAEKAEKHNLEPTAEAD